VKRMTVWKKLTEDLTNITSHPVIEIIGRNRVLIEHYMGIKQYETTHIEVQMIYGIIQIMGENMELVQISSQQLVVTGRICGIMLSGGCNA